MKRAAQLKWPDAATGIRALCRLEPPLEVAAPLAPLLVAKHFKPLAKSA